MTIVLEATVDPQAADGTETCSQGVAHYDADANGSNDSEEPTDDPSTAADDDPTCLHVRVPLTYTPIAGTIDAPTMTEWGAIAFGSLLALVFFGLRCSGMEGTRTGTTSPMARTSSSPSPPTGRTASRR